MSSRTTSRPQQVLPSPQGSPANSGDMTQNLVSAPSVMQSLTKASYALSWSGSSPVGTVSVELSNDYSLNANGTVNNPGTWNIMTLDYNGSPVTTVPVSGNTGSGFIDILETAGYAIRLIYTPASGSGTLTVIYNAKVA